MKEPTPRSKLPPRSSDNEKRRLHPAPIEATVVQLLKNAKYHGISKHKANPQQFGLPAYGKPRGDATLCDDHANFQPTQMANVPALLARGITAGLIGKVEVQGIPTMVWTVADDGWIFEARITNPAQADYHGYPVRSSEAIAEKVYRRFADWAVLAGGGAEKAAAGNCKELYGFAS